MQYYKLVDLIPSYGVIFDNTTLVFCIAAFEHSICAVSWRFSFLQYSCMQYYFYTFSSNHHTVECNIKQFTQLNAIIKQLHQSFFRYFQHLKQAVCLQLLPVTAKTRRCINTVWQDTVIGHALSHNNQHLSQMFLSLTLVI